MLKIKNAHTATLSLPPVAPYGGLIFAPGEAKDVREDHWNELCEHQAMKPILEGGLIVVVTDGAEATPPDAALALPGEIIKHDPGDGTHLVGTAEGTARTEAAGALPPVSGGEGGSGGFVVASDVDVKPLSDIDKPSKLPPLGGKKGSK